LRSHQSSRTSLVPGAADWFSARRPFYRANVPVRDLIPSRKSHQPLPDSKSSAVGLTPIRSVRYHR
jgi:hypothetical protein